MKVSLTIQGGDQLARNLRALPKAVESRVVRAALREAAEPIRDQAAGLARRAAGAPDLADHIAISRGTLRGETDVAVAIGPTKEARSDQPDRTFDLQGFYLEYGTSRQVAQPFLRPAFDSEGPGALQTLLQRLWSAISTKANQGSGGGLV